MKIVTLDWETYYDKEYSLSRMSTEDYVCDPRFQIIMVGIKVGDQAAVWHSFKTTEEYRTVLEEAGIREHGILAHNTMFDGLILAHHFGIVPPLLLDTMGMAQAVLKPKYRSISLASCLKNLGLSIQKGTYVANMLGKRLEDLSGHELSEYGQYCVTDCEGEYALFRHLSGLIPRSELQIIDMTLRMYLEPQLEADYTVFKNVYDEARQHKKNLLSKLPEAISKPQLMSNPQLAKLLEDFGVDVPMKISPTTNKPTYAFSKNDPGWKDLEDTYADHPVIGPILAARLGVKSTIAETRAERLMGIAQKYGKLRVPLRYYGAHTGRYGGMEKINCQNFTRVNPKNPSRNQLRYGLKAPKGYSVLAADLSQIEARINAWLSGCTSLMTVFREEGDPYCEFASKAFRRRITKADERERFIGKTCILGLGYGMGDKKLRDTLRIADVSVSVAEAANLVQVYRTEYEEIPALWRLCDDSIDIMRQGGEQKLGPCKMNGGRIILPNGMELMYHNLRWIDTDKYRGWGYDFAGQGRTLWGGKIVENVVQALARIIITNAMRRIKNDIGIQPALQAHDELVYVVPTPHVELYESAVMDLMTEPPAFAPDLPVAAETAHGPTYGDAK